MQDQDIINEEERHEAATEEPTQIEELKRRGAKIKACNDRSYAKMVRIAELANECVQMTTHAAYMPGQYGRDYMAFGKAICEIRQICQHGLCGDFPDYEWMAGMMTSEHFDPNRLAQEIEAKASEKPVDYPTFYTPGWLVEIAKWLQGKGTKPGETAVHAVVRPQLLSDIGMVMDKRVSTDENGIVTRIHYAGIRHVCAERPAQLWEIDIAKDDNGSHITCWRDHERVFSGEAFFGLSHAADFAISMMIRKIIGDTAKKHRDHFRNIRRATATTKAIVEKELA